MFGFHKRGLIRSALLLSLTVFTAFAAPPDRIGAVRATRNVALRGTIHPRVGQTVDQGILNPATAVSGVTLVFAPSAAQQAALDQLLEEQRDPSSPNYQWALFRRGCRRRGSPSTKPRVATTGFLSAARPGISERHFTPSYIGTRTVLKPISPTRRNFRFRQLSRESSRPFAA